MDQDAAGNTKGLRKMYANAQPVINPEHQYDRQATFLRIKDLLEERARALNHVHPNDRPAQGWGPQTFENKYIYPYLDDISAQYPDSATLDSDYLTSSGFRHIPKSRNKHGEALTNHKNFQVPAKKYNTPVGPARKVFRGQKAMPYSAYSSSYGTYPNHAILSIGNADQGIPRWEIRAVSRDGPIHDSQFRRKVTIYENPEGKNGVPRPYPKPMNLETQRVLKSILKKGTTYPIPADMLVKAAHKEIDSSNIRRQTSSEEILMVAKENAFKRQSSQSVRTLKDKIPVFEKMNLKKPGAPVVTWLRPTFVNYANSEMVAMPDTVMEKLKQGHITEISSTVTDDTSSMYASTLAINQNHHFT